MHPDDEIGDELDDKPTEHHIELTLTDLEWEIVNQAISAPIKGHLIKGVQDKGYTQSETEIESTLEELTERWADTW